MEILLLIAIVAIAAAGLFVAATFNKRTRDNFTPIMNSTGEMILGEFEETGNKLRTELQAITGELRQSREVLRHLQAASAELRQAMQTVTDELQRNKELLGHLDEQVGVRQNQLDRDATQLDHRIAGLGESLAEQSARISGIYRYVVRRETQAGSSAENGSLLLAMLEAESYVDSKGWGGRPYLYTLTAPTSIMAADQALLAVEQERLAAGDLTEALGGIHWPTDVVGCVLVAELADLPVGSGEHTDIDALTAEQWTSPNPDGRPVRIAIGVGRDGAHQCGFRIKGDDEVQVRTELASDLVTALLGTF